MPNTIDGVTIPSFPSTWYHPIYGAREVETLEDFQRLDQDWRPTAARADMDRTQTEAQVVMNHNEQVKREMVLNGGTNEAGAQPTDRAGHSEFAFSRDSGNEANKKIVRNSVQAQESLNRGYPEPL